MSGPFAEAIVLAGGLGTRLRSVVADRPKALAPISGRPFLHWQLAALAARGVRRAVLAVGHRAGMIRDALGDDCAGVALAYSTEDAPLGTGGALRRAAGLCRDARVLAVNGDTFLAFDAAALAAALHPPHAAALALAQVPDTARYGRVALDGNRVTAFLEKGAGGPGPINGGVYALDLPALADAWPREESFSFERAVLPALAAQGRLGGVVADGFFLDIGTPADFALAQRHFKG